MLKKKKDLTSDTQQDLDNGIVVSDPRSINEDQFDKMSRQSSPVPINLKVIDHTPYPSPIIIGCPAVPIKLEF